MVLPKGLRLDLQRTFHQRNGVGLAAVAHQQVAHLCLTGRSLGVQRAQPTLANIQRSGGQLPGFGHLILMGHHIGQSEAAKSHFQIVFSQPFLGKAQSLFQPLLGFGMLLLSLPDQSKVDHGGNAAGVVGVENLQSSFQNRGSLRITSLAIEILPQVIESGRHVGMRISQAAFEQVQRAPIVGFGRRVVAFGGFQAGPLREGDGKLGMIRSVSLNLFLFHELELLASLAKASLIHHPLNQVALGLQSFRMTNGQVLFQQPHGPARNRLHQVVLALQPEAFGQSQQDAADGQAIRAQGFLVSAHRLSQHSFAFAETAERVQALPQLHLATQDQRVGGPQSLRQYRLRLLAEFQSFLPAPLLLQTLGQPEVGNEMVLGSLGAQFGQNLAQGFLELGPLSRAVQGLHRFRFEAALKNRRFHAQFFQARRPAFIVRQLAGLNALLHAQGRRPNTQLGGLLYRLPELKSLLQQFRARFGLLLSIGQTGLHEERFAIRGGALQRAFLELLQQGLENRLSRHLIVLFELQAGPMKGVFQPGLFPLRLLQATHEAGSVVFPGGLVLCSGFAGGAQMGVGLSLLRPALDQNSLPEEISLLGLPLLIQAERQFVSPFHPGFQAGAQPIHPTESGLLQA